MSTTLSVTRFGRLIEIQGDEEILTQIRTRFVTPMAVHADMDHGLEVRRRLVPLISSMSGRDDALVSPAGLIPFLVDFAVTCGATVDLRTSPVSELHAREFDFDPSAASRSIVDAVVRHSGGVIQIPASLAVQSLADALWAFRGSEVIVVDPSRRRCQAIRRAFLRQNSRLSGNRLMYGEDDHIRFTTPTKAIRRNLGKCDLLIAVDAPRVMRHDFLANILARARNFSASGRPTARAFAIEFGDRSRSRDDFDCCRALFGETVVRIATRDSVQRRIVFDFLDFRHQWSPDSNVPINKLLKQTIWTNRKRNQLIAEIAAQLAHSRKTSSNLLINQLELQLQEYGWPNRIAIVAGSIEHAAKLSARLAGWTVCAPELTRIDNCRLRWHGPVHTSIRRGRPPNRATWIITPSGMNIARSFDLLVRADAGVGLVPVDRIRRARFGETRPLIVFDIHDTQLPVLRARATARKRVYLENGWVGLSGQDACWPVYEGVRMRWPTGEWNQVLRTLADFDAAWTSRGLQRTSQIRR